MTFQQDYLGGPIVITKSLNREEIDNKRDHPLRKVMSWFTVKTEEDQAKECG
jgi:hypothetical protein